MADTQFIRPATQAASPIPRILLVVTVVYWSFAAVTANGAFQRAYQDQSHRVDSLVQKGLLSYNGKLDPRRLGELRAEAEVNRVCWAAHPKPSDAPEPWFPEECGAYLPADLQTDIDAANFAIGHPGSPDVVGWAAASQPLLRWGLAYLGLGVVILGLTLFARRRAAARRG
jgi:hypothetical protein